MKGVSVAIALLFAGLLASCDSKPAEQGGTTTGLIKQEAYCSKPGLEPSLRNTFVLIDAQTVVDSKPENFKDNNPALFALLLGLGAPAQALESGAMAPRERLTILVGSSNGKLDRIFTGCIPGLNQAEFERRVGEGGSSKLKTFMGSDVASDLQKAQDSFRGQLLTAIVQIKPVAKAVAASFDNSVMVKMLRALGPGSSTDEGIRRIFIYGDSSKGLEPNYQNVAEARTAGFKGGETAGMNLGLSALYFVPAGKEAEALDQEFLTSFVMASKGRLDKIGPFSPDGLARAPAMARTYSGEIQLTAEIKAPIDIRLATTGNGELVDSWFSYSSSNGVRSTPIIGRLTCSDEDHCGLRGDPNGGMGQWWRIEPGNNPQPVPGGPFGGMRMIEATDNGGRLTGRVFDTVIYLQDIGDLKFTGKRVDVRGAK